ncbi:MAG: hypothetical protein VX815_16825, partial [Gemmatimonadota bacterium]|nr:hypothetical protein [Gemmatimonadota bacterium]
RVELKGRTGEQRPGTERFLEVVGGDHGGGIAESSGMSTGACMAAQRGSVRPLILLIEENEALGVREGPRTDHHRVHYGEDRSIRAYSKRDRDQDRDGD